MSYYAPLKGFESYDHVFVNPAQFMERAFSHDDMRRFYDAFGTDSIDAISGAVRNVGDQFGISYRKAFDFLVEASEKTGNNDLGQLIDELLNIEQLLRAIKKIDFKVKK